MKTTEIDDLLAIDFNNLPLWLMDELRGRSCINCDKPLDERNLTYVVCKNGQVRWWHDFFREYRGKRYKMLYCYQQD